MSSQEELVRKCVEEHEKSLDALGLGLHLMKVTKKGYKAMKTPWSPQERTLDLRRGPIDLFDERLVRERITPMEDRLTTLLNEDLPGFTEFLPLNDKTKSIVEQIKFWRKSAKDMGERAQQLSQAFVQNRAALNTFLPVFYPYFMLRESYLSGEVERLLQNITGKYFSLASINCRYRSEYSIDEHSNPPKLSTVSQPLFLAPPKAEEKSQQSSSSTHTNKWTRMTLGT